MKTAGIEEKKEFFKNHKKKEPPPKEESSSEDEEEEDEEKKTQENVGDGNFNPYDVINPISTCVGPVGEFILQKEALPKHPSLVLYGKRRTGKSYSLRWLMFNCFRDVPFGTKPLCHLLCISHPF